MTHTGPSPSNLNISHVSDNSLLDGKIENQNETMEDIEDDPYKILRDLNISNINRLVVAHLNINHIIGKFDSMKEIIRDNIDILAISETKIDHSFPTSMFDIYGYSLPFRCDRDANGGGVLVYVKEGIPCRKLKTNPGIDNLEGIFLEINLRKTKWLLFAGYNYSKSNICTFLKILGSTLDYYV